MTKPGPKPMPTRIRQLEGNRSKTAMPKNELQPVGDLVKPDFVVGAAAKEWKRAVASMPPGFFTAADSTVLAIYCTAWASYREAYQQVARDGVTSLNAQGGSMQNPAILVMAKQSATILQAADRLGMSPSARTRLEMPTQKPQSKFSGLSVIGGGQTE